MRVFCKKNIITFVISLFLSLFFLGSVAFYTQSRKKNNYVIKSESPYKIKEVWINGQKEDLSSFAFNNDLIYNEENDFIETNTIVTKELSIYEFNLVLETTKDDNFVTVKRNSYKRTINLKNDESNIIVVSANDSSIHNILYTYLKNSNIFLNVFLILASVFIYYLIIKGVLKILLLIKNDKLTIKHILLYYIYCFCIIFSIFYFGIELLGYFFELFLILSLLSGLFFVKNSLKGKIHNLFIYLFVPISIFFMLSIPFNNVPDECSHFYKSYILANKLIFNDIDKDNDYCVKLDDSMENLTNDFDSDVFGSEHRIYARTYFEKMHLKYSGVKRNFVVCWNNVKDLSFISYTWLILSVSLSKVFGFTPIIIYLNSKLINLFMYILIVYFCIKNIKKFKYPLFIISSLPIALQEAGAFSQDSMHNAIFILLFTLIINAINNKEKISRKEIGIITFLSIIFGFCKMGYFPIIFLCLLIPKERFNTKKEDIISKIILILPIILVFIYLYFFNYNISIESHDAGRLYGVIDFIKSPFEIIKLYYNTLSKDGLYLLIQGQMDGFGYSSKYNSGTVSIIVTICYTLLVLFMNNDSSNKYYKIFSIGIGLIISFIISLSMLGTTPVGSEVFNGLQARYFIPVNLLFLSSVCLKKISIKLKNREFVYGLLSLIIYFGIFITIIGGFYY